MLDSTSYDILPIGQRRSELTNKQTSIRLSTFKANKHVTLAIISVAEFYPPNQRAHNQYCNKMVPK